MRVCYLYLMCALDLLLGRITPTFLMKRSFDETQRDLKDTGEGAEMYAWQLIIRMYGKRFEDKLRIYNFAVFMSMILEEKRAENK